MDYKRGEKRTENPSPIATNDRKHVCSQYDTNLLFSSNCSPSNSLNHNIIVLKTFNTFPVILLGMSFIKALMNFFRKLFGGSTAQQTVTTPTVQRPVYKHLIVTNEGVPTAGAVKGVSIEKLEFITTLEKDPEVKSEIMKLTCNKEDERVNEYEFETETGRYKVYSGQVQRYPKV